ncbi:MAG: SHOCT domain-containing protein [Anaerolineales bacterium]|nr:SHOCT domain-containing protein [Anaerolineales bacterium]
MKNLRWVFILGGVIAVVSFTVSILGVAQEADWSAVREMNIPRMLETEELFPIPVMLIGLGITLWMLHHFYRLIVPPTIKNGVTADARVLKVWDTGTTINDNPQIGMLLEVKSPSGEVFQAEAKTLVSRLNAALVRPGITAQVVYDPEKPKRIQLKEVHVQNPAEENSVARMEELETLRTKRLITEEEYQEKRKQILANL